MILAFIILVIIWFAGTLRGQEEAARGECSLAHRLGRGDELPLPEAASELEVVGEIDKLVEIIRHNDDRYLREKSLAELRKMGAVAMAFFDASVTSEASQSDSEFEALLRTIRHNPHRIRRDAALDELEQLGLVERL